MASTGSYLELVVAGAANELASWFSGEPVIEYPAGRVEGRDALDRFVAESSAWLQSRAAQVERLAVVAGDRRDVNEWVLHLDLPRGRWGLPVAAAVDRDGDGVRAIRVYHSMWPITGGHAIRAPLLDPDPTIVLSGAVADYQRALAAGDLEGILAAYEPDATIREPSGGPYAYSGTDEIRAIYSQMFANGGGIPLRFCTATDDGTACAIEFTAVRWGATALPPQAGVAVYVRGGSGRLAAARIYDDVDPPGASDVRSAKPEGA